MPLESGGCKTIFLLCAEFGKKAAAKESERERTLELSGRVWKAQKRVSVRTNALFPVRTH